MRLQYILLLVGLLVSSVQAQNESKQQIRANHAAQKGIQFLLKNQQSSGCFGTTSTDGEYTIAGTSFSCLALMANGVVPSQGDYGANLDKGINYILRAVNPNGYISLTNENSRMHGHGFATLMLAEAYGMSANKERSVKIREALNKAVNLILQAQTIDGGWGYTPEDTLHEGSITVCELQALRAARNLGIWVPKRSIDKAIEYLRRSANPDGSFKYRLGMTRVYESFPLASAGVSSLNALGEYDSPEVRRGLEFMMKYLPPDGLEDDYYLAFYFYGHFYAAQAMYHAPSGHWEKWYPAIRRQLIEMQNIDGSWGGKFGLSYESSNYGNIYTTAIAVLILQIPNNYLSIFQR